MRALTVQQPWAWAIIYGSKDVENRTALWSYRGPLAIHAGTRDSMRGYLSPLVKAAVRDYQAPGRQADMVHGAIIGIVELADAHPEQAGCCEPWGETAYVEHGGRVRREVVHYRLEDPVALDRPVYCAGRLGLWVPPADVLAEVAARAVDPHVPG